MTKKELIKRIEEYKPKYIYQRYDGRIHKYEVVNDNYLVETKTGMSIDFISHLMLGKVSENLIDLIKCGDYVNGYKVLEIADSIYRNSKRILIYRNQKERYERWIYIQEYDGKIHTQDDITEVVTKEQFESISYKVTKM